jgi:UDP-N-acetylmuramoyl-L-alanyl-D-glutamate--2,6-diaminopimelate ligase
LITDRKQAKNCSIGSANDIILIAGKGHETYQEINGVRHHFDMETVRNFRANRKIKNK